MTKKKKEKSKLGRDRIEGATAATSLPEHPKLMYSGSYFLTSHFLEL